MAPEITFGTGELLPHRFTIAQHSNLTSYPRVPPRRCATPGLSAGLCTFCCAFHRSLGLRVTKHPVPWSSDFPPRRASEGRSPGAVPIIQRTEHLMGSVSAHLVLASLHPMQAPSDK
jgi:hypothetical protein